MIYLSSDDFFNIHEAEIKSVYPSEDETQDTIFLRDEYLDTLKDIKEKAGILVDLDQKLSLMDAFDGRAAVVYDSFVDLRNFFKYGQQWKSYLRILKSLREDLNNFIQVLGIKTSSK